MPGTWRATFGSPAGIDAMGFYRRLRWAKWTRDSQTQEPVNLTDAEAAQGWKMLPDGRKLAFDQKSIIDGRLSRFMGIGHGQQGRAVSPWRNRNHSLGLANQINFARSTYRAKISAYGLSRQ